MNSASRTAWVLIALLLLAAEPDSLRAQRITVGGFSPSNQSDNDEDQQNQGSNRQGGRRSQSGGSLSSEQKLQQFLQGGSNSGQQGQGSQNPSRRSAQNQFQQGPFPGNQSFQNAQQLQNLQQGNQGLRIGTWQGGQWKGTNKFQNWNQAFGNNIQPFSKQWYEAHPNAWKYNNSEANVWVMATLPGVYSWLGWGDVPQQYRVYYGSAQPHQFDPTHYGDWYPLGVYSLMAGPGDIGTRIVQLAVDRHGHIAGNYYDMITNNNYSVSGDIRRQSQRVYWSLNKNKAIRFRAPLYQLLQPYGTMEVQLPGGNQQWHFVRLEN